MCVCVLVFVSMYRNTHSKQASKQECIIWFWMVRFVTEWMSTFTLNQSTVSLYHCRRCFRCRRRRHIGYPIKWQWRRNVHIFNNVLMLTREFAQNQMFVSFDVPWDKWESERERNEEVVVKSCHLTRPILEFTCYQPASKPASYTFWECVEMNLDIEIQCVAIQFACLSVCSLSLSLTHSITLFLSMCVFVSSLHPHFVWVILSSYLFHAWFQIHFHIFVWHVNVKNGDGLKGGMLGRRHTKSAPYVIGFLFGIE